MEQKAKRIEFRFGKAGKLAPLIAAAGSAADPVSLVMLVVPVVGGYGRKN